MRIEDLMIDRSQTVAEQAAILQNKLIAIRTSNRREIVSQFDKEEHRLEHVTQYQGVNFINDSRSCTVNATYYSFETIKNDVIWVAGGNDTEINYTELIGHVSQKVKTLVCIGENNQKLIETFSNYIESIYEEDEMEAAVRKAFYSAKRGDIVLLSTGCACDKLYPDYKVRGTAFKKAIAQL